MSTAARQLVGLAARRLGGLALLAALLAPSKAVAQSNSALAESLFRDGRALLEAGKTEAACEKFDESHRLDPALGTLLNLAECHALAGRTASAWARFRELAEKARRAGQKDRETYAEEQLSALAKKLSYVTLRPVPALAIAKLDIDGQALGPASYSSPIPLDPGRHRVSVTAGSERYEAMVEVPASAGEHSIELPLDEAHRIVAPKPPARDSGVDARAIAGWSTIGAGLIGVGLGSYFGARALSLRDDSDERCDGSVCDAVGLELYDEAHGNADASTVAFAIAGAALATGTGLLIWVATDGSSNATVSVAGRF
jgi:tetratricopeptide (TPR) repeat protein